MHRSGPVANSVLLFLMLGPPLYSRLPQVGGPFWLEARDTLPDLPLSTRRNNRWEIPANLTRSLRYSDLPEIKDGEDCTPGALYSMDCNTCRCGLNNALLCTKMACFDGERKSSKQKGEDRGGRKSLHVRVNTKTQKLDHRPCDPGYVYRKKDDCRYCFCSHQGETLCSTKEGPCNKTHKNLRVLEDYRPPVTKEEFAELPSLRHVSAKCDPGRTYRVKCNACLCLANRNLLCNHLLCLNVEETRKHEAKQMTGTPCKNTGDILEVNCVRCYCNSTKYSCSPVAACVTEDEEMMLSAARNSDKEPLALDYHTDMCQPKAVYLDSCNHCYCQEDQSLRCTLKTCLNFNQVQQVEKERLYLKAHGL